MQNRLKRPIAVVSSRYAYQHLCEHCGLDPSDNDIFHHVGEVADTRGVTFSRVIEVGDYKRMRDHMRLVSAAREKLRGND